MEGLSFAPQGDKRWASAHGGGAFIPWGDRQTCEPEPRGTRLHRDARRPARAGRLGRLDGGGIVQAPTNPTYGRKVVGRQWANAQRLGLPVSAEARAINGEAALIIRLAGTPGVVVAVVHLETKGGFVRSLRVNRARSIGRFTIIDGDAYPTVALARPPIMDAPSLRVTGVLLVVGALVFWVGAATPPYRQWMGVSTEEYLAIVGASRANWLFMHGCFALGAVLSAAGFAAIAGSARHALASGASAAFSIATALWLVQVGYRVSIVPRAAEELARTGIVPNGYEASSAWMSILFGAHMLVSYAAIAGLGLALRAEALVPPWIAWTAIMLGTLAIPGFATPVFQPPLMLYVAPALVGAAILVRTLKGVP